MAFVQVLQERGAVVTVLKARAVDLGSEDQAKGIDGGVALAALDPFARIIAVRVDYRPPFSALLTL